MWWRRLVDVARRPLVKVELTAELELVSHHLTDLPPARRMRKVVVVEVADESRERLGGLYI